MNLKPQVLVAPHGRRMEEIFEPSDLDRLAAVAEILWAKNEPAPESLVEAHRNDLYAIISPGWRYGDVSRFPKLKAILEVGGGFPSPRELDYNYCFAHHIRVLTCAPAFGRQVAEMALGMVLAATREIVDGHIAFTQGVEKYLWEGTIGTYTLYEQVVGFIGFGGLARALKPLLDPFRCQYLAYDPWLPEHFLSRQGVLPVTLDELLMQSKIIFVLAVPTPENKHMLNAEKLALIQKGAVLALVSRAHLVDFDALTQAVMEQKFKAVIDVFPVEPLPQDHPIRKAPGVVLSAHRAGPVERDMRLIGRMAVDDIIAMIRGLPPTEMQIAQPELIFRFSS